MRLTVRPIWIIVAPEGGQGTVQGALVQQLGQALDLLGVRELAADDVVASFSMYLR
jgi:hypothetical protein